jgi:hypothetical protein
MQKKELSLATSKVADRVISGRATAEESNRDLQTEKESQRPRIVSLTVSWCFMAAGLFVALAPMPARADNPIAALQAQVAALQSQVNAQQGQITTLQGQVSTLQTQLAAVQSNKALGLGQFVSVVSGLVDGVNGPHIYFTGANIHIVSGSTTTADSVTGLGNLIIGYDEPPLPPGPRRPPPVVNRSGSHNLVIGRYHNFTKAAFGGLVAGQANTISNEAVTVSGGVGNIASGVFSSVSGGVQNTASGEFSSVSGGTVNIASGGEASVTGGENNTASGANSIVSGGLNNTAGGPAGIWAIVLGGENNVASGNATVVLGSNGVSDSTKDSIAPQPPFP